MDQKLRELERKAQDDPQAAMQLAAALKRLVQDQWQAVPCDNLGVHGNHVDCIECGGAWFLRINVTQLNEYVPHSARKRIEPQPVGPIFMNLPLGYGPLPTDLVNHYDDQ